MNCGYCEKAVGVPETPIQPPVEFTLNDGRTARVYFCSTRCAYLAGVERAVRHGRPQPLSLDQLSDLFFHVVTL